MTGLRFRRICGRMGFVSLLCVGLVVNSGARARRAREAAPEPLLRVPAATQAVSLSAYPPVALRGEDKNCRLTDAGGVGASVVATLLPKIACDGSALPTMELVATFPPSSLSCGIRAFRVESNPVDAKPGEGFSFRDLDQASLELREAGKPVLVYNHGVITNEKLPPSESRRSRACYVHPLYGLDGEVLTDDFPKDHYHHHGIFWAWPHIRIGDNEYDLWTYKNIQEKFVRWLGREAGAAAAQVGVENAWFVGDTKVATQRVWIRSYRATDNQRAIDITLVLIPLDRPLTLWGAPKKSYGGLSLRFAPREETLITVPSGRTTEDLPDTQLAWADFSARFANAPGESGAAIFVPPAHPDFPPTWLTRHYGILCVGWPGVNPRTFAPGEPIRQDYRIWLHKAKLQPETLRSVYDAYVRSAGVR